MSTPLFKSISCNVSLLVNNIAHGSLGLPDIQRPFVWSNAKVRDLFDSMFKGYPVGFLLFWEAESLTAGKQIGETGHGTKSLSQVIIDGQQRLTSLYAVMTGNAVFDKNFVHRQIKIAFNPIDARFEVSTSAYERSSKWISNISDFFVSQEGEYKYISNFIQNLKEVQDIESESYIEVTSEVETCIAENLKKLSAIKNYTFSALEIEKNTDEELVADIFVRVNSGGQKLSQANFILTLMSVFWDEGRNQLEEFCQSTRIPSVSQNSAYNYFIKPEPDDMIRVPIVLAFKRARLKYGYQVLRGKDLDSRNSGDVSPERRIMQFEKFKDAQAKSLNVQNWKEFLKSLYLAGFRSEKMISSKMAIIYSYSMFLIGKYDFKLSSETLKKVIARWFFMTFVSGRYSSSPESKMEADLANLRNLSSSEEFVDHLNKVISDTFSDDFWSIHLPNELATSSARSPTLYGYYASLVILNANVLFSSLKVSDMLDPHMKGTKEALERHHLYPKGYLASIGIKNDRDRNQIANYALVEWDKNIKISDNAPSEYFPKQFAQQHNNNLLDETIRLHALPPEWEKMDYYTFLAERRLLIAQIIKEGFNQIQ